MSKYGSKVNRKDELAEKCLKLFVRNRLPFIQIQ